MLWGPGPCPPLPLGVTGWGGPGHSVNICRKEEEWDPHPGTGAWIPGPLLEHAAGGRWPREHLSPGANLLWSLCPRENPLYNVSACPCKATSSRKPFVIHPSLQELSVAYPLCGRHLSQGSSPLLEEFLPFWCCPDPRPHCLPASPEELLSSHLRLRIHPANLPPRAAERFQILC